jgi:hypothetical protein
MRRFHNPRYACESLERKLSPSGFAAIPIAAEIHIPNTQMNHTHQVLHSHTSLVPHNHTPRAPHSVIYVSALDTTSPPTNPAPPDGDGDPPAIPPSGPSGPGLPA